MEIRQPRTMTVEEPVEESGPPRNRSSSRYKSGVEYENIIGFSCVCMPCFWLVR